MAYVLLKHKVADYARWKPLFDADGANRQADGSQGGQLFRSGDDLNDVIILFEWDLEQARQFSQREELSAKMQEAGVLGPPELYLLEEIEQSNSSFCWSGTSWRRAASMRNLKIFTR